MSVVTAWLGSYSPHILRHVYVLSVDTMRKRECYGCREPRLGVIPQGVSNEVPVYSHGKGDTLLERSKPTGHILVSPTDDRGNRITPAPFEAVLALRTWSMFRRDSSLSLIMGDPAVLHFRVSGS